MSVSYRRGQPARVGVPSLVFMCGLLVAPSVSATDDGGVQFIDIAAGDSAGITYRRAESPRDDLFDALKAMPLYTFDDVFNTPLKSRGAPGVALFDYDGDDDLDIYVTNGPGVANSLYSNQWSETGVVEFVDHGVEAGVGLVDVDGDGVCYGDIDNDGDMDLLVLGMEEENHLFENQGDGTFDDITLLSEIGGGAQASTTCSFGDVDGDGLLDVVVANAYTDFNDQVPIFLEPFARNQHNQLFKNLGSNVFVDISTAAGIEDSTGFVPAADGAATITWSIALVDLDQDGDLDLVQADDQAAFPPAAAGGVDRGFIHIFDNDGTGHFTNITVEAGTNTQGQWMSLAFGDLDCNGQLDIFGSNIGDFMGIPIFPGGYNLGSSASRWFLGQADGTFTDPGVGDSIASVFGWGSHIYDYDNDGDDDIIYHGGLDVGPYIDASNGGVVLQNQGCSAQFVVDDTVASGTDHIRRNVHGLAVGDLDNDGFADVVTVSNLDNPAPTPLVPYGGAYGSVFDEAPFVPTFVPVGPGEFVFSGIEPEDGTLSVELNSGDNGNRWVKVTAKGMVGIVDGAGVNRDGLGAVLSFTPRWGNTSTRPVVDGASYASSHAREQVFGLGAARRGRLDVLWPGGVRNRVYGVRAGQRFTMPEIPCSYDAEWADYHEYAACVSASLDDMYYAGEISGHKWVKLYLSAAWAYLDQ